MVSDGFLCMPVVCTSDINYFKKVGGFRLQVLYIQLYCPLFNTVKEAMSDAWVTFKLLLEPETFLSYQDF